MLRMSITMTPKYPSERMEEFRTFFGEALQKVHKACVFKILETCVAWTRVDTGRLRAGWFPYMAQDGFPYQRSTNPPVNPKDGAIEEGMAAGGYMEGYLKVYVYNGVDYAGYLEEGKGTFDITGTTSFQQAPYGDVNSALPKFAELYASCMTKFLDNADQLLSGGNFSMGEVPGDFGPPTLTD